MTGLGKAIAAAVLFDFTPDYNARNELRGSELAVAVVDLRLARWAALRSEVGDNDR